jgi:hypothetical protein
MKIHLHLILFVIPSIIHGQTRQKFVVDRTNYCKSHPIFISQISLDENFAKKYLSEQTIEEVQSQINIINKNIRTAIGTFWDINKNYTFILDKEVKSKKKEFKDALFLDLFNCTVFTNEKNQVSLQFSFSLSCPKKSSYFNSLTPHFNIDSSLVLIITEIRQLKLNVTAGTIWNQKDLDAKQILINKDNSLTPSGEKYLEFIRLKYSEAIKEVDNKFLIDALLRKDPKYLYIQNWSTFNVEDGTMIPLE